MNFADVDAFAKTLPGVTVGTSWGNQTWKVGERGFAWQRPLNKADIKRLGDAKPPEGEILAVRVENLDAKDALLSMGLPGFFTIEHFNGYAAVLIQLKKARAKDVRAAVVDAHRVMAAKAPKKQRAAKKTRTRKSATQPAKR
jgi:hypothetical protein